MNYEGRKGLLDKMLKEKRENKGLGAEIQLREGRGLVGESLGN